MRRGVPIVLTAVVVVLFILCMGPFLVPVPPLEATVPPEQLADPDSRFVEVNGLQVHYKTTGQAEPTLVLLHGFGASVFSWREVMLNTHKGGYHGISHPGTNRRAGLLSVFGHDVVWRRR